MDLVSISKKYGTQRKCLLHLERLRWPKGVTCIYCQSKRTKRTKRNAKPDHARHHCLSCKRSFSVLAGTIFEDTKLPLPKWFFLIASMLNAKLGKSAKEIHRDMGISVKSSWYCAMRARCAMLDTDMVLDGEILEMDEAYIGGKPRKAYKGKDEESAPRLSQITHKRGRGTKKVPIVAIGERRGKMATKVIRKLTSRNLLYMLKSYVKGDKSILVTDQLAAYKKTDTVIERLTVKHSKQYSQGIVHVNTVEGYFSLLKNGIRGNYRAISEKYLVFYLLEYQYKYNRRNKRKGLFEEYLRKAVADDKCFVNYKPKMEPQKFAYR